jgi:tetratricopeptide (TPR) repeat protein
LQVDETESRFIALFLRRTSIPSREKFIRVFYVRLLLLTALVPAACSCAPLAPDRQLAGLPVWQLPHRADVRRIAVLPFAGDVEFTGALEQHLGERLLEASYFDVVSLPESTPLSATDDKGDISRNHLQSARAGGVDTLISGRLRVGYGTTGVGNFSFGPPIRKAVVTLKITDVATGKLRDQKQVLKEFKGEVEFHPDSGHSENELFNRLVRDCADDLISDIFIPRSTVKVPLALPDRQAKEIWRGNQLARQGRWTAAREVWESALAADPDCHAAQYNLGLACEASQQYIVARGHYAAARQASDQEIYREATARCQRSAQSYALAMQSWGGELYPLDPPRNGDRVQIAASREWNSLGRQRPSGPKRLPAVQNVVR